MRKVPFLASFFALAFRSPQCLLAVAAWDLLICPLLAALSVPAPLGLAPTHWARRFRRPASATAP